MKTQTTGLDKLKHKDRQGKEGVKMMKNTT